MIKGLGKGIVIALLPLAVAACGKKDEPAAPEPVKKTRPAAPPAAPEAPEQAQKPAEAKAEDLDAKYRNPFQSHIILLRDTEVARKIKGPLECCDLDQFRIVAVVVGTEGGFALVQGPDKKRYVVKRGDAMGPRDGKVIRIINDGLIVREHIKDEDGKVVSFQD
ncbi:MAG: pilus assembly protein PilP, partial [Deltaproteobacteria bacterium]|nr:pilus assembly protein PilP [Deltaproteobacteria bacterium]